MRFGWYCLAVVDMRMQRKPSIAAAVVVEVHTSKTGYPLALDRHSGHTATAAASWGTVAAAANFRCRTLAGTQTWRMAGVQIQHKYARPIPGDRLTTERLRLSGWSLLGMLTGHSCLTRRRRTTESVKLKVMLSEVYV